MPPPSSLRVLVRNPVGGDLGGAVVDVLVRRGIEWQEPHPGLTAPVPVPLRDGFIQVEVTARAPDHVAEKVFLTLRPSDGQWESTNPPCGLALGAPEATLTVVLGRVRLAPITPFDDTMRVPGLFLPGAVLADQRGYRTVNLGLDERMRVLKHVAMGDPNAPGWGRFHYDERQVKLADRGNWLLLEYGDVSGQRDALRHLLGVWAPHSFTGVAPHVVVQLTPNTTAPRYPADRRPFTGVYPYGCVLPPDKIDATTKTGLLRDTRQAYAELTGDRCFVRWKILHQLYAARPDLFDGPNGPIVITPSPALIDGAGPLRAPFEHPDAVGRMIAEVLRFLYANMLTLPMSAGARRLRFLGSEIRFGGSRPQVGPIGLPQKTVTTVVTHSAGVVSLLALAKTPPGSPFPNGFPQPLWGGRNPYCDANWQHLWVTDGIATPGGIGTPKAGGDAARTWAAWLRREGRRMGMVYTPSGLDHPVAPELVTGVTSRSGSLGRIEESAEGRVRWLWMDYAFLRADPAENPPGVRPGFAGPKANAFEVHDKVYEFGVGYAAAGLR